MVAALRSLSLRVVAAVLLTLVSLPLFAWGQKGHAITNEAAFLALPSSLPPFFLKAQSQLVYLAYDPDRWLSSGGPALNAESAPEHFLDYEYVADLPLSTDRYSYLHTLEESGRLRQYGISNATPGLLPWRIAEVCDLLEMQWRVWRASSDDRLARAQIEQNIIQTAGILGHYIGDSANPHHTTWHYNGWADARNPEGFRNDCDTHSRFESAFVTNNIEVTMIHPRVAALQVRDSDYFALALAAIRSTNELVVQQYRLDRDGAFDDEGTEAGRLFAVQRLAAGAALLRDLWFSCYLNSAQSPKRRG